MAASIPSGAYFQSDRTITKNQTDALSEYANPQLVYTYLLDTALALPSQDIPDFRTSVVDQVELLVPGFTPLEPLVPFKSVFSGSISLANNRLVAQKSTGVLAVRRWNLPAS